MFVFARCSSVMHIDVSPSTNIAVYTPMALVLADAGMRLLAL